MRDNPIKNQDDFNKFVVRALCDLYGVAVSGPATKAAGEPNADEAARYHDEGFRSVLADLDDHAFGFEREAAKMHMTENADG